MNKLLTGSLALGLMFAAASCGSDDNDTSEVTSVESSASAPANSTATADSTATDDSTSMTTTDMTVATGGASPDDLEGAQAEVFAMTISAAEEADAELDEDCFAAIVAQLSDEDAQKIVDAGSDGNPELSPEGEALGAQAASCVTIPTLASATPMTVTT